ncbi:ubiquitin carboxyl-terminal hydrolase 16-like isoform X2 [Dysidea avara]|uniref:ubiquitin carboxyl-terminal hydrolase 16-like isoform X2 n=1 Tax=Dysidea avara TaxID=196820 RepID=UPI003318A7A5
MPYMYTLNRNIVLCDLEFLYSVYCILWKPGQPAEEPPDCEKGRKEGENRTMEPSTFWRLVDNCLCLEDHETLQEHNPDSSTSGIPPPPLPNDGFKCYCNAIVQAMSHVQGFHQMLEVPQKIALKSKTGRQLNTVVHQLGPISTELCDLLCKINPTENSTSNRNSSAHQDINTRRLLSKVNQRDNHNNRFNGSTQQDSHEFLRCLLQYIKDEQVQCIKNEVENCSAPELTDEMKSEYRRAADRGVTVLEREIGGANTSTIICRQCLKPSQLKEPFFDLSLSIPDQQVQVTVQRSDPRRETPDLVERHESSTISYCLPGAINEENTNLTASNRQEIVASPVLNLSSNPGNSDDSKNSNVNPKVATEFSALQEYLRNEGFHYHPPSLERPLSTNGLEQSLLDYTNVDVLGDDQRFICNHCNNDHSLVSKQALIMRLQKLLILHIKRFEIGNVAVTKNNEFLSFALLLDMAPYCTNGCLQELQDKHGRILYGLKAVVVHRGRKLSSGHYVAYVRRFRAQQSTSENLPPSQNWEYDQNAVHTGDWYLCSDQIITKCSTGFAEVRREEAYILFYELLPKV